MTLTSKHTVYGCYMGYVCQAIVNNLPPLLFLTFHRDFGISLDKISLLITVNFCIQILVDFLSPGIIRRSGYRKAALCSFLMMILGLTGFYHLPFLLSPYLGILICMIFNAIGGGILEVIVSPMVDACPLENKESQMSLLHSFYCWGHMAVVLLSTLFFTLAGIRNWRFLPVLWALVPLGTFLLFTRVPIYQVQGDNEETRLPKSIFSYPVFWLLFFVMICAGASEQAVSQWSSLFAEDGLKVSKTLGDLLGPCSFAFFMGLSRALYGLWGHKLDLIRSMKATSILCVLGYLLTSLSPIPLLALTGCGICGFSVGLMWPGAFALGASCLKGGGTFLFAMFALAGDVGCSAGPALVGLISESTGNMSLGLFTAILFPAVLLILLSRLKQGRSQGYNRCSSQT